MNENAIDDINIYKPLMHIKVSPFKQGSLTVMESVRLQFKHLHKMKKAEGKINSDCFHTELLRKSRAVLAYTSRFYCTRSSSHRRSPQLDCHGRERIRENSSYAELT